MPLRIRITKKHFAGFLRNFVFGVEDSLVSTVGLLSGVAIADVPRATIFLTGIILIFVEAFSMGVGSFLSEQSSEGYMKQAEPSWSFTAVSAVVMFASYFASGFIPLFPYVLFETKTAFPISIAFSLVALFILGMYGASLSRLNILRHGMKMMVVGGTAIALGVLVGVVINSSSIL